MPSSLQAVDHLRIESVTHSYGIRRVLTDVDLVVSPGERLGLIGENGVGKSTLLRIAAGAEVPDAGWISRPRRTMLLPQEVRFAKDATLAQLIEASLAEVRKIESDLEEAAIAVSTRMTAESDARYATALGAAERAEVWTVSARRDELLSGLGVGDIPLSRQLGEVSGGQRSRFALASLLLSRPEALLLDEPTNHLDDTAVSFLREQLMHWSGPVMFTSHDRAFLDEVATSLLDIDPSRSGTTRFGAGPAGGPYTQYLAAREADRTRWEAQYAREQEELTRLKHAVNVTTRTVAPGRGPRDNDKNIFAFKNGRNQQAISRRVRDAEGRLNDLQTAQVRKPPAVLSFAGIPRGSRPLDGSGLLLHLSAGWVEGRLTRTSLQIATTSQLLLTGANGTGKSTLLGILAGRTMLDGGILQRRQGLRIGLLQQDIRWPDPHQTPRTIYASAIGPERAEAIPLSSLGLIASRDLDRSAGALSIGQQRRLALALIFAKPPHLFLLDEPTNHLSLSLVTELEDALGNYPGAVVVASHDRWLRQRWRGERLALEQRT